MKDGYNMPKVPDALAGTKASKRPFKLPTIDDVESFVC